MHSHVVGETHGSLGAAGDGGAASRMTMRHHFSNSSAMSSLAIPSGKRGAAAQSDLAISLVSAVLKAALSYHGGGALP